MAQNSPYSLTYKIAADYKYFPYYQKFGNSGICVQFNIPKEDETKIEDKLKKFKCLNNKLLSYDDASYMYTYNEPDSNIKLPEITDELGDLSAVKLGDDREVSVYLIEKGKLKGAFAKGSETIYNYSIGVYNFKDRSTLVYWFLLYQDFWGQKKYLCKSDNLILK